MPICAIMIILNPETILLTTRGQISILVAWKQEIRERCLNKKKNEMRREEKKMRTADDNNNSLIGTIFLFYST